ncbi:hypothetical protein AAZX31_16G097500 [Glycine max]
MKLFFSIFVLLKHLIRGFLPSKPIFIFHILLILLKMKANSSSTLDYSSKSSSEELFLLSALDDLNKDSLDALLNNDFDEDYLDNGAFKALREKYFPFLIPLPC